MSNDDWLSEDRKKQLLSEGWQPPPERRWLRRYRRNRRVQMAAKTRKKKPPLRESGRRLPDQDQKLVGGGEWDAVILTFFIGFIVFLALYFFW